MVHLSTLAATAALLSQAVYGAPVKTLMGRDAFQPAPLNEFDPRFPMVGPVFINGDPRCTGTLVGPRTVLTTAACLRNPQIQGAQISFSPNYFGGHSNGGDAQVVEFLFGNGGQHKGAFPASPLGNCDIADNWAVMVLDRPMGDEHNRYMVVSSFEAEDVGKEEFNIVGYPVRDQKTGGSMVPIPFLQEHTGVINLASLGCPDNAEMDFAETTGRIELGMHGAPFFKYDPVDPTGSLPVLYGIVVEATDGPLNVAGGAQLADFIRKVNAEHPF